ncbi:hypothetical protein [Hymenobacter chitinivorans]|uniref:hypothetical protein n=1 Tax=Hymenobacter chitinivorans TaxID=89969 RepID=UPI000C24DE3A|nr:hypothetical protein [Hymenobacter chitinivorans]
MKLQLQITLVAVLLAAHTSSAQNATSQDTPPAYFPLDSLVGKWFAGSTEYIEKKRVSKNTVSESQTGVLCNVCPELDFHTDSTITIKGSGTNEMPQVDCLWNVRGNTLSIRPFPQATGRSPYLSAGQYTAATRVGKNSGLPELVLTNSTGTRYILRRIGK